MPFTQEDFLHLAENKIGNTELFTASSSLKLLNRDDVSKFFGVKLSESEGIAYVPVKMCHSLPTVNSRKRCFTPRTLNNSFASAIDSVVDVEHFLINNGVGARNDKIVGHIKAAVFDPEKILDLNSENASKEIAYIPTNPAPLTALVTLYLRADGVKDIIDQHIKGKTEWKTSMECGHDWRDSYFYYRGDFIPFNEAPGQLLEGVSSFGIENYKGHEVAAVLGGLDGNVDFWGMALTTSPADKDADILGIFGGQSKDLASEKIFRVPLLSRRIKSSEAANFDEKIQDRVNELASITVIGETEEHEDGHKHKILSDLTIVPANKHTHGADFNIQRGTNPSLTGKTGIDYGGFYDTLDRYQENPHLHLISVPLKGKYSDKKSELFNNGDEEEMKIKDIADKIQKLESDLANFKSKEKVGDDNSHPLVDSLTGFVGQLKEMASEEEFDDAITQAVNEKVESGELLSKEDHEKLINEKLEAKDKEYEVKAKELEIKNSRIAAVQEAGLSLDYEFKDGDEDEGVTIKDILNDIPVDESGDKSFKVHLSGWKTLAEAIKKSEKQEEAVAEAANDGKGKVDKKINSLLAVGSPSSGSEAANKPKIGKHAFS